MKLYKSILIGVAIASSIALSLWTKNSQPNIVFVRTEYVFENYDAMKEAKSIFSVRKEGWQANLDTLQADYQKALQNYQKEADNLSEERRNEREFVLRKQQENILKYAQDLDDKALKEEENLTIGVLNQMNEFIQEYSKKNNYDIVVGTTNMGNLLYGEDLLDISEDLLKALNENHQK